MSDNQVLEFEDSLDEAQTIKVTDDKGKSYELPASVVNRIRKQKDKSAWKAEYRKARDAGVKKQKEKGAVKKPAKPVAPKKPIAKPKAEPKAKAKKSVAKPAAKPTGKKVGLDFIDEIPGLPSGNKEKLKASLTELVTNFKKEGLGVTTSGNAAILSKFVRKLKGGGYGIQPKDGADIIVIEDKDTIKALDSIAVTEEFTANKTFEKKINEANKKMKNKNEGERGEWALSETFKAMGKNPKAMTPQYKTMLEKLGIDTKKPFEVVQQGDLKIEGEGILDYAGKQVKLTSKADIVIKQGGKEFGVSVKYTGGSAATIGTWQESQLEAYFKMAKLKGAELKAAQNFLKSFQDLKKWRGKTGEKADSERARLKNEMGVWLRMKSGQQFLEAIMTRMTPSGILPEEARANHLAIVSPEGHLEMFAAMEYITTAQKIGTGHGGSGFMVDVQSAKRGGGYSARATAKSEEIVSAVEFKMA